jgi:hypothetical protein
MSAKGDHDARFASERAELSDFPDSGCRWRCLEPDDCAGTLFGLAEIRSVSRTVARPHSPVVRTAKVAREVGHRKKAPVSGKPRTLRVSLVVEGHGSLALNDCAKALGRPLGRLDKVIPGCPQAQSVWRHDQSAPHLRVLRRAAFTVQRRAAAAARNGERTPQTRSPQSGTQQAKGPTAAKTREMNFEVADDRRLKCVGRAQRGTPTTRRESPISRRTTSSGRFRAAHGRTTPCAMTQRIRGHHFPDPPPGQVWLPDLVEPGIRRAVTAQPKSVNPCPTATLSLH